MEEDSQHSTAADNQQHSINPKYRRKLHEVRAVRNAELWEQINKSSQRRLCASTGRLPTIAPTNCNENSSVASTEDGGMETPEEKREDTDTSRPSIRTDFANDVQEYLHAFRGLPTSPSDEDEDERRKALGLGPKKKHRRNSIALGIALQSMQPSGEKAYFSGAYNFSEADEEVQAVLASQGDQAKKAKALKALLQRRRKEKEEYLLKTKASTAALSSSKVAWSLTSKVRKKLQSAKEGRSASFSDSYQAEVQFGSDVCFQALNGNFLTVDPESGAVSLKAPEVRWKERNIMPFRERRTESGEVKKPPYFIFRVIDLSDPERSGTVKNGDPIWIQIVEGRGDKDWTSGSVLGSYIQRGIQFSDESVGLDDAISKGKTRSGIVRSLNDWKKDRPSSRRKPKEERKNQGRRWSSEQEDLHSHYTTANIKQGTRPQSVQESRKKFSRGSSREPVENQTDNDSQKNIIHHGENAEIEKLLGFNTAIKNSKTSINPLDLVGEEVGVPRPIAAHNPSENEAYLVGPATSNNETGVYQKGDPGYEVLREMRNTQPYICGKWRVQTAYKEYFSQKLVIGGRGAEQRRADAMFGPTWEREKEMKQNLAKMMETAEKEKRESKRAASYRPSAGYMFSSFEKASKMGIRSGVSVLTSSSNRWDWKKAGGSTGKEAEQIQADQKLGEELKEKLTRSARIHGKELPKRWKGHSDGVQEEPKGKANHPPENLVEALGISEKEDILTGKPLKNFSKIYLEQDWFYVAAPNPKGDTSSSAGAPLHLQTHSDFVSGSYKVEWRGVFTVRLLSTSKEGQKNTMNSRKFLEDKESTSVRDAGKVGQTNDSIKLTRLLKDAAKVGHNANKQLQRSSRSRRGVERHYKDVTSGEQFSKSLCEKRYQQLAESESLFRAVSRHSASGNSRGSVEDWRTRSVGFRPKKYVQPFSGTKLNLDVMRETRESFSKLLKETKGLQETQDPASTQSLRQRQEVAIQDLARSNNGKNTFLRNCSSFIDIDREIERDMQQAENHALALDMKAQELSSGLCSTRRTSLDETDFFRQSTINAAKLATKRMKTQLGLLSDSTTPQPSQTGAEYHRCPAHHLTSESVDLSDEGSLPKRDSQKPSNASSTTFEEDLNREDENLKAMFKHESRQMRLRSFYGKLMQRHFRSTTSEGVQQQVVEFALPPRADPAMVRELQAFSQDTGTDSVSVALKMSPELSYKDIITKDDRPELNWSLND